ncbi:helix-turn-helix transcriptional regulator [Gracilimonas mengyeensis]|uniref:AraC-type DNA-binding protein n=1 Tax=Gracilimonas mengyeensis TaxID=1302730 RepID=A0A521B5N0_9BACT|nr:helix-turn-helix transcriptional regulator [Gracilimonas mengyeensis]SMO42365.1 AraC-type DNA-binding protein [Gracilimonas mengyeensis]
MHSSFKSVQEILEKTKNEIVVNGSDLPQDVKDMLCYIRKNLFNDSLTISEMRNDLRILNKNYAARFKLYTGYNPKIYIIVKRLETAKKILTKTELSITQVSIALGFLSHSSFSKIFIKSFGISPSKWIDEELNSDKNSQK